MAEKTNLTASQIRYLLALKKLDELKGIRGADIATKLGLSKPSVHNMMDTFFKLGLIERKSAGLVFLTQYGSLLALEYEGYFEKVKEKLNLDLESGVPFDLAICAFLAEVPKEFLNAIF